MEKIIDINLKWEEINNEFYLFVVKDDIFDKKWISKIAIRKDNEPKFVRNLNYSIYFNILSISETMFPLHMQDDTKFHILSMFQIDAKNIEELKNEIFKQFKYSINNNKVNLLE